MISYKDIQNSKKNFPDFIRYNSVLTDDPNTSVDKIFPRLGLENGKEDVQFKKINGSNVKLDKVISLAINRFKNAFRDQFYMGDLKTSEQFRVSSSFYVMDQILAKFRDKESFRYLPNGEPVLATPIVSSFDKKVLHKAGTNLFKLTKNLFDLNKHYVSTVSLIDLNKIEKSLAKANKVIFSGSGMDCLWDLSTISMRGIKSCMRWDHEQSKCLIGSMVDPYCGVIYLTDGSRTDYGQKMIYRALVRVVVSLKDNKPALMLDRLYSHFYKFRTEEANEIDNQVREIFLEYLRSRIKDIPVFDSFVNFEHLAVNYRLPMSTNIQMVPEGSRSYLDTKLLWTEKVVSPDAFLKKETSSSKIAIKPTRKKSTKKQPDFFIFDEIH